MFIFQQHFCPCNSLGKIHFCLIIVFCLGGNLLCKPSFTCCQIVSYSKCQDESFHYYLPWSLSKIFPCEWAGTCLAWWEEQSNPTYSEIDQKKKSIPPHTLWSGRHTRSGVHSKDTPPQKGGPHNSTGKTEVPPSLDTPTSAIRKFIEKEFKGSLMTLRFLDIG